MIFLNTYWIANIDIYINENVNYRFFSWFSQVAQKSTIFIIADSSIRDFLLFLLLQHCWRAKVSLCSSIITPNPGSKKRSTSSDYFLRFANTVVLNYSTSVSRICCFKCHQGRIRSSDPLNFPSSNSLRSCRGFVLILPAVLICR